MTTSAPVMTLHERIADFLAQKRIAVAGMSATRELPGNGIYRKLKATGHEVAAILPGATTFEGAPCYPNLAAIPGGVDGLMIVTRPAVTTELVRQAVAIGVPRIWMHQSLGHGGTSIAPEAVELCRTHGITLIAGSCPMIHCEPVDFGHRCIGWLMRATGSMPE